MKLTLAELSYKVYAYQFDMKYFAKTIRDKGYEDDDIKEILKEAQKLYKHYLNALDKETEIEQYNELSEAHKLAESILHDMKSLSCQDDFIHEKTDLLVETFSIKENTDIFMKKLLKNKEDLA
jgi:hypothetical protein